MPLAGNPLHRAGNERRDPAWLAAALADERTRFLPVQRLKLAVEVGEREAGTDDTRRRKHPDEGRRTGGRGLRAEPRRARRWAEDARTGSGQPHRLGWMPAGARAHEGGGADPARHGRRSGALRGRRVHGPGPGTGRGPRPSCRGRVSGASATVALQSRTGRSRDSGPRPGASSAGMSAILSAPRAEGRHGPRNGGTSRSCTRLQGGALPAHRSGRHRGRVARRPGRFLGRSGRFTRQPLFGARRLHGGGGVH